MSHAAGGRTFRRSFAVFDACEPLDVSEPVLFEPTELPRNDADRLVLAFRRNLGGSRGELE